MLKTKLKRLHERYAKHTLIGVLFLLGILIIVEDEISNISSVFLFWATLTIGIISLLYLWWDIAFTQKRMAYLNK